MAGKRKGTTWIKRGSKDRQGIQHNPYKVPFFKAFARREHCSGGVEFAGGYDGPRYVALRGVNSLAMTACCSMLRAFSCGGKIRKWKGVVVRLVRLVRLVRPAFTPAVGGRPEELTPDTAPPMAG